MSATGTATGEALLAATTRLGPVHLTVSDLDRAVPFYEQAIGLRAERRATGRAALGAGGEDLVVLHERPGARRAPRHAGLFHVALLLPTRPELAHALRRLLEAGRPLQGASDHGVSEALYLADPDGNGIELYRDRPREEWPRRDGRLEMVTAALDLHDLLAEATEPEPRPEAGAATAIGHVHLHVGDLDAAVTFHRDVVGFELTQLMGDSAAFLSAGGYHHHVGLNTWAGVGIPPAPPDAIGLRHWTVVLADPSERAALRERLERAGVESRESAGVDSPEAAGGLLARDPAGNAVTFIVADDPETPREDEG
ncbi:MAG: VOC family protein [Actinomycetota bacterium]|nr:VOC family protein [Actinomycetota bacterium]